MVQKQPGVELMIKMIDFGSVGPLRSEQNCIDFQGFQMDVIGILRLFTDLYIRKDWKPELEEVCHYNFHHIINDDVVRLIDLLVYFIAFLSLYRKKKTYHELVAKRKYSTTHPMAFVITMI